jgi:hypothetical protein
LRVAAAYFLVSLNYFCACRAYPLFKGLLRRDKIQAIRRLTAGKLLAQALL